eukprot:594775-Amphidinium_carterae.2
MQQFTDAHHHVASVGPGSPLAGLPFTPIQLHHFMRSAHSQMHLLYNKLCIISFSHVCPHACQTPETCRWHSCWELCLERHAPSRLEPLSAHTWSQPLLFTTYDRSQVRSHTTKGFGAVAANTRLVTRMQPGQSQQHIARPCTKPQPRASLLRGARHKDSHGVAVSHFHYTSESLPAIIVTR